jgi:phage gp36-like protein
MSEDCAQVHGSYATLDEYRDGAGVPAAAMANVPLSAQRSSLMRASRLADTFLRDRYSLPLKCPYDPILVQYVCHVATWYNMSFRGFNPNAQQIDMVIRMNYDDAVKGLTRIANGQQQLAVRETAPAATQPEVATSPSRGFTGPGGVDIPFVGPNTWGQ